MPEGAFEHVRRLFGEARRAGRSNRLDQARQHVMLAFGALQTLSSTGGLSDADSAQLRSEFLALAQELGEFVDLDDDAIAAGTVGQVGVSITMARAFGTVAHGEQATAPSRRRRTIALDPSPVALADGVELDLVAIHVHDEFLEVWVRLYLSPTTTGSPWTADLQQEIQDRVRDAQLEGQDLDALAEVMREAMDELRPSFEDAAFDRVHGMHRLMSWDVSVSDAVGTEYRSEREGGGGGSTQWDGHVRVTPAPPPGTTSVDLTILDADGDEVTTRTVSLD